MPSDQRLYMTFPIEFPEHPKVKPLSDKAFRVFVEMNAYSRRLGLNGTIAAKLALAMWPKRPLSELVASHPERPLVQLIADEYVIRDYADHQLTTDAIEDLRAKRAEAGRKGGKARASAQASASALAQQDGGNPQAESELRVKDRQTDITDTHSHVTLVTARDGDEDEMSFVVESARELGVKNIVRVQRAFEGALRHTITPSEAVDLARVVLDLSASHVRSPEAYIETTCTQSPHEVNDAWQRLPHPGRPAA